MRKNIVGSTVGLVSCVWGALCALRWLCTRPPPARVHAAALHIAYWDIANAYLKVSGVARSQKRCASGQAAAVFNSSQQESVARLWTFILEPFFVRARRYAARGETSSKLVREMSSSLLAYGYVPHSHHRTRDLKRTGTQERPVRVVGRWGPLPYL